MEERENFLYYKNVNLFVLTIALIAQIVIYYITNDIMWIYLSYIASVTLVLIRVIVSACEYIIGEIHKNGKE